MPIHVILTEDIQHVGIAGQVVRVKDGYARNFLMPRGMALLATEGRVRELEHRKRVIDEKQKKEIAVHQEISRRLSKVSLEFKMHAGEEGKLFGSVTNADIYEQLKNLGFDVERRKIVLPENIKQLGSFDIPVRLHREVIPTIKINVIAADGPPPGQPVEEDEIDVDAPDSRADEDEDD